MRNKKNKVYVIAEIGINHNGSIKIAKKLIDIAKKSGADAVKFQTYLTDKLVLKKQPLMPYQNKNIKKKISQFEMLKKSQLNLKQHKDLLKYCKKKKIDFLSAPYDLKSAKLLINLGLKTIKIASTDVNNLQLIRFLLKKKMNIILSTGCSGYNEIKEVLKRINFKKYKKKINLLHCISYYPAPIEYLNLKAISTLSNKTGLNVGFSDHSLSLLSGSFAVMQGANIIEKHITLNRNYEGPDHKASLLPKELFEYIGFIRKAEKSLGDGIKKIERIEKKVKGHMQKSLIVINDCKKGKIIRNEDLSSMRPARGISVIKIDNIIGRKLVRDKNSGEYINWNDFK